MSTPPPERTVRRSDLLAALGNDLYSGKTSLPFIAKRRIWYTIAIVVIALSAVLVVKPGLNPGIDFKGGSEVTVTGVADPSEGPGNDVLADKDLSSGSSVTTMGGLIRTDSDQ